jgi:hypothetical protein
MAPKKKEPETDYSEVAKNVLKAELRRRGVSYADLAELLTKAGTPENDKNLNNKIARGGFSAAFLMQCLDVIGAKAIQIAD